MPSPAEAGGPQEPDYSLSGEWRDDGGTSEATEGKDLVSNDGIWIGVDERSDKALLTLRDPHRRQQNWVFFGVLGLLVVIIGLLVFGQATKMSQDFALELMRSTVPVLVGAIAGVLGFLFRSGSSDNNTKP